MKKKPKISVIVPVYNAEEYLEQCLDSIVNQTLDDIEIICVNDGSKDSSLEILKRYKKKYCNLKVINQENKGIIGARITGYENANGKYVGWVDNDDFIELSMYEKMYKEALNDESDIVICNYEFYPQSISRKKKWFKEYKGTIDWHFISNNGLLWNKIVRKQFLDQIDFAYLLQELGEGSYTIALLKASKITTLNEELYYYRVGHNSTSGSFFGKTKYYLDVSKREMRKLDIIRHMNLNIGLNSYFEYYALRSKLILAIVSTFNNDRELYSLNVKDLKQSDFFGEEYCEFLQNDFNKLKIFFLKYIFINSYCISRLATKFVLR